MNALRGLRCCMISAIGAATSVAVPVIAHADGLSVALVQEDPSRAVQLGLVDAYRTISAELDRTLLLQNINVIAVEARAGGLVQSNGQLFQQREFADQDYGIVYSISPQISENRVARELSIRASGQIFDVTNGRMVTSFQVSAPETVPLPKDEAACDKSCVANEISALSFDLARELSFVLTQKLHFLREDRGEVDLTDTAAIQKRLSGTPDQTQLLDSVATERGTVSIDRVRSINVEVYFDFDSSKLTARAQKQLAALGKALASDDLSGSRYLIAGHTDAKGSAEYNQKLSARRAEAVRRHLLQQHAIDPKRLVSVGLGETRLYAPKDPNSAINRRVEIAAIVTAVKPRTSKAVTQDYTLSFTLLPRNVVMAAARQLEATTVDEIELLKSNTTERIYSVRTDKSLIVFEEQLMMTLLDQGIDLERLRFSVNGRAISVENLKQRGD